MSETILERIENGYRVTKDLPILVYPGDILEVVNALRARIAQLEAPRTCSTCAMFDEHSPWFCRRAGTPVHQISDPENFGCIHHAPRPGEQ